MGKKTELVDGVYILEGEVYKEPRPEISKWSLIF